MADLTGVEMVRENLQNRARRLFGADGSFAKRALIESKNCSRKRIFSGLPAGCHASK
jgi:hypothetical protein